MNGEAADFYDRARVARGRGACSQEGRGNHPRAAHKQAASFSRGNLRLVADACSCVLVLGVRAAPTNGKIF